LGTEIHVNAKRGRNSQQEDIEELTDDELHDLLQRFTPSQVRAYAFLLSQMDAREYRAPCERPVRDNIAGVGQEEALKAATC